jgi:hypothetical protein
MTATDTTEYRKLELDSSNDIIRHDARRSDRKYAEAAWHALQAGLGRQRMGQMMFDAGDFTQAAADWLSAAACFDLATDPQRMQELLARVQRLNQEGKIPPERRDIHAALKEREAELKELEQKLKRFQEEYDNLTGSGRAASQESLDWLLRQVREFPGLSDLHATIARQAAQLGQKELSARHSVCAEQIKPGCPAILSGGGAA